MLRVLRALCVRASVAFPRPFDVSHASPCDDPFAGSAASSGSVWPSLALPRASKSQTTCLGLALLVDSLSPLASVCASVERVVRFVTAAEAAFTIAAAAAIATGQGPGALPVPGGAPFAVYDPTSRSTGFESLPGAGTAKLASMLLFAWAVEEGSARSA